MARFDERREQFIKENKLKIGYFKENGVWYFATVADTWIEEENGTGHWECTYEKWKSDPNEEVNILTPEFDTSDTVFKYGRDYEAVVASRI